MHKYFTFLPQSDLNNASIILQLLMSQTIKWSALESCPAIMNKFLDNLGVSKEWRISDIPSFDEELIYLVPSPILAVLLLFPFSKEDDKYCKDQEDNAENKSEETNPNLYFMRQTISNACGTVALIHAIANSFDKLSKSIAPDSPIKIFIDATRSLSPIEKAKVLESNEEIATALEASQERDLGEKCDYHFVTIVCAGSGLFELDGRKLAPVFHGYTTDESFLIDAGRVCKDYMARDSNNLNFTALAFGAA